MCRGSFEECNQAQAGTCPQNQAQGKQARDRRAETALPGSWQSVNVTPQKPQQNAGVCLASRSGSWRLGQLRKALKNINMTDKYVPIKYSQNEAALALEMTVFELMCAAKLRPAGVQTQGFMPLLHARQLSIWQGLPIFARYGRNAFYGRDHPNLGGSLLPGLEQVTSPSIVLCL